eukprot:CAMPEP_0202705808 /NCGR_PEP_ID=MMETSP1385-20130828/18318_1 /ASSEMBLY_ACC=CAM_ASM_000861 /TAXON_ID=933848 /ORGANISM="Elphidium margaritaceum" /LENGTH=514 /DNA_ID=CAMNT_0049364133 /DNA_START=10 /DNA_END=1554 /DNA_ORIENTATION=+
MEPVEDVSDDSNEEVEELISDGRESLDQLDGLAGGGGNVDVSNKDGQMVDYTVDEAISMIGTGCFQWKLIIITGLLWSTDAMEMMIITIVQPVIIEIWDLDELASGSIALAVYMGMLFGTFTLGMVADRIGRRSIVGIACIGYCIASLVSAFSTSFQMLLATRFLVGIFVGGGAVAFTLAAEFSPTEKRGRMLVMQQAFWCFGALWSSLLGWLCMDYLNWRYFLMLAAIPIWFISVFLAWLPESPHYLMTTGKFEECQRTLQRLADGNSSSLPDGYLRQDMSVLNSKRGRLRDVFVKRYRSTSIVLYIMLITSVFSYFGLSFIGQRIFIIDRGNEYQENVIAVLGEVPAVFVGLLVIDLLPRKTTLNLCFVFYCLVCFLLCFSALRSISLFALVLVFVGRCVISLAFMTQFIYFSEYYPTAIRATAIGGASSLDEISKIAANYLAEDVSDIGRGMIIFGCVGAVALVCSFALKVETLGRGLNDNVDYGSKMELQPKGTMRVKIPSTIQPIDKQF